MDRYSPHHPPFSREQTSIYHNISRYNKSKANRHNNSNKTYSHYIANELSKSTFHMLNPSSSLIQINSIYELSKVSIQSSFHIILPIHPSAWHHHPPWIAGWACSSPPVPSAPGVPVVSSRKSSLHPQRLIPAGPPRH